ncbi:endonuclease domain-containing protein [Agromyces protaetiae]|uniref:endonuclease domain-containing protein n=1 Tax=Agromyces protaetiae TaxID=2509455 RepID=UPI001FB78920|nr:DUF559 domain-containing protein [Agromyces protaetiae]
MPRRLEDARLDVSAFIPNAIPRGAGIRGHRLAAGGTRVGAWNGLPVVAPEDAWCQLATLCTFEELVVAGDSLVRRNHPISTLEQLGWAVGRRHGRRGFRLLAAALEAVREGTDSPEETRLRLDLVAAGLPEPEVNVPIFDAFGRLIAIGDLVYESVRVIVEYDGDHHRTDDRQYARDLERIEALTAAGWRVIRFTKRHRGAARGARIDLVRRALAARAH